MCAKEADGLADVGVPLLEREIRLVNGEVWLRAASMAEGYWHDGEIIPLLNEQGWFATRDRGELHNGRLTLIGRLDNLFFSGGEGIQPEEVERVIAAHPDILQVFVVPVADPEYGQRPVAVVESDTPLATRQLSLWVSDKLAGFQRPVHWLAFPASLKTGGLKISRQALHGWGNTTVV